MKKDKLLRILEDKPKKKAKVEKTLSERNLGRFERDPEAVTTIYVGNLTFNKKEMEIKTMFSKFGPVSYVRLVCDKNTKKSKGIAFVQMPNYVDAMKAIKYLNATEVDGRTIKVSVAVESEKAKKSKLKIAARPVKDKIIEEEVETKKIRPSKRKRDKGLKLLFNHLNS